MPLAVRLLTLVALAVTPALCVVGYNEIDLRRSREAELRMQTVRTADQAAAEVRQVVEEAQRFSAVTAKLPVVRQAAVGSGVSRPCSDLLVSVRQDYPGPVEIGVANKAGVIVCTTHGAASARVVEGDHFRRAVSSNAFVIGSYGESRTTGARYLTFAHPVRDEAGVPIGAVLTGVDLRWFAQHMRPLVGPPHAVLSVHDRDLVYLLRVPEESDWIGRPPPPEVRRLSQVANKGAIEARGSDGVRRIGAIGSLTLGQDSPATPDLHVAFGLSRDAAFQEIDAATRRGVALFLISLGLAAGAAYFGGRHFIRRPVERLLAAAGRWREGDYTARVRLPDRSSEFGRLAGAYEELADTLARREAERDKAEHDLRASEERLRLAQDAGGMGLWDWDMRTDAVIWSESFRRLWRIGPEVPALFERFLERVHPDDRTRARQHTRGVIKGEHPFDVELRSLEFEDGVRWLAMKGELIREPGAERPIRMIGICQDITDRKRAEDHLRLLVGELNHRVKNTLATVQSLAAQSLKGAAGREHGLDSFEARLMALAKTHDLLTREGWEGASLAEVVTETIAPYAHGATSRFTVDGPPLRLAPGAVVPLSMALHELCTNAAKYGALSNEAGQVAIAWNIVESPTGPRLTIRWGERGGPPVVEPARKGFGTRFIERGLPHQLGGEVEIRFEPDGLACHISLPVEIAVAPAPARSAAE